MEEEYRCDYPKCGRKGYVYNDKGFCFCIRHRKIRSKDDLEESGWKRCE